MSYDVYADFRGSTEEDVRRLVTDAGVDIATRIHLLAGIAAQGSKDYTVSGDKQKGGGYKQLVHASASGAAPYAKELLQEQITRLNKLDLLKPSPALASLPYGSWFLQFEFTLAKPWLSKDDDPFYVADSVNPVRKDKVFKVPVMAASSWKGLVRWAAMHLHLVKKRDDLTVEEFAGRRLAHTLLFGDEKGEEAGEAKDFAKFLDTLKPEAKDFYRQKARERLKLSTDADMPHYRGRLNFYPTFFDAIDLEVINPHSRKTRAGTLPIYLECVPRGAKGTFSMLYVPFDLIGEEPARIHPKATADLLLVAESISAMMRTYGFSAKRTSGFGAAEDRIENGRFCTRANDWPAALLSTLPQEANSVQF